MTAIRKPKNRIRVDNIKSFQNENKAYDMKIDGAKINKKTEIPIKTGFLITPLSVFETTNSDWHTKCDMTSGKNNKRK
ncbi:MAG: hypothetical protein LBM13_00355 [Candidatus Ancillula sp.]|jgi:hypothetical protein|nr:hypothetical protein [Candidatus Ancillula sp.]